MKIKKFNENKNFDLIEEISQEQYFELLKKKINYNLKQIDIIIKEQIDKIIDNFVVTKHDDSSQNEISINFELNSSLYFNLSTIEDDYFISRICFESLVPNREPRNGWIYHKIDSTDGLSVFADYLIDNL
jgi:hypothetical protein